MSNVKPIPEGMAGVVPHLTVKDCARAIEYYKQVFGATEMSRFAGPDGKIMHASIRIGGGPVFLNDEFTEMGCVSPKTVGGTSVYLMLYVNDVDATFKKAVDAGGTAKQPVDDQFWGDRYGLLEDPFGHFWEIATHKVDLTPEQLAEAGKKAMQEMSKH